MVDNQEFNWEEVSSEVTSDVEKKNPIGNEQVTQLESQDGQPISSESDLGGQSTLPTDDKDKGVKYYTKTDKNGKTTYWKKDKWGEKAITKTTYDFENKKQVEDKMATNAEFTEVVPLDKQSDVDKMLQVDVPIAQEPKQPIEPKVEEPKKEEDLSWFGDFAGRFDRAVLGLGADALKWIGIAASKIDKITGSEPNKKTEDYATYKWGQQLDEFIKDSFPTDVSRDEDFTSSIATGLGSIAGFAIAGPARTAFFGAASQSVPEYENAKQIVTDANSLTLDDFINKYTDPNADELSKNEIDTNLEQQWFDLKGKNPEDVAFKSFMANSVIGASEALPINMAIGRIGKAGSSRFKDALVNAVSGGSEEAIQEGMTQYFSNLTTQQLLDENKNVLDGVAEATGTAFVLGGVLNGTLTALTGRYEQSEGKEKEELKSQIDRVKELQSRLPVDVNETVVTLKSKEELQNDINEFETKVNTHNEYVSNISNPDNLAKIASSISIDGGKLVEEFVNDVDDKVQKGYISTQQGEQARQSLKTLLQANDKVPASIDNIEKRGQAVKLVAEKSILEEEIKDKDKALSAPQLERIKQINEELTNIALGKEPVAQEEVKVEEIKPTEEVPTQEALKDVESTAKALGGVDEANMAKIILPETQVKQKVYHGGESKIVGDFKNLNPNLTGFYFSSDIDNSKTYGNEIVEAYVDIKNPLIIDAKGLKFTDDIPVEAVFTYPNEKPYTAIINLPIDDVVYAVKNGKRPNQFFEIKNREKYDGVIFKNLIDPALTSRREIPQDTIVAFENSQIKRADNKSISEAYHKAKADGSNPELVKAVEDLLGKEQVPQPTVEIIGEDLNYKRKQEAQKELDDALAALRKASSGLGTFGQFQALPEFVNTVKAFINVIKADVTIKALNTNKAIGRAIKMIRDAFPEQTKDATNQDIQLAFEKVQKGVKAAEKKELKTGLRKLISKSTVSVTEEGEKYKNTAKKLERSMDRMKIALASDPLNKRIDRLKKAKESLQEKIKKNKEAYKEKIKTIKDNAELDRLIAKEKLSNQKYELEMKRLIERESAFKKLEAQKAKMNEKLYESEMKRLIAEEVADKKKELRKQVKEMLKDKVFAKHINNSNATATALINKVNSINTQKQLDNFIDYLDKLAEDGQYNEKLNEAYKNIKGAYKKKHSADIYPLVKEFLGINIKKLTPSELDNYLSVIKDLNQTVPDYSKLNGARNLINKYNQNQVKEYNEAKVRSSLDELITELSSSNPNDVDEYKSIMRNIISLRNRANQLRDIQIREALDNGVEADTKDVDNLIDSINAFRSKTDDVYNQFVEPLKNSLVLDIRSFNPDTGVMSGSEIELLDRFNRLSDEDLKRLDVGDLSVLSDIMDRTEQGYVPVYQMNEVLSTAESKKAAPEVAEQLSKVSQDKIKAEDELFNARLSSVELTFIESALGLKEGALSKRIIQPLIRSLTKSKVSVSKAIDKYHKNTKKNVLGLRPAESDRNKVGMVMHIMMDAANKKQLGVGKQISDRDWFGVVLGRPDAVRNAMGQLLSEAEYQKLGDDDARFKKAMEKTQSMGSQYSSKQKKMLNKIYDELILKYNNGNGQLDIDRIKSDVESKPENVFSKEQVKLYNASREAFNDLTDKQKFANEVRGIEFNPVDYYIKRSRKGSQTELTVPQGRGSNAAIQSESGKSRLTDRIGAVETDIEKLVIESIVDTERDYNMTQSLKYINKVFNELKTSEVNYDLVNKLQKQMRDRVNYEYSTSKAGEFYSTLIKAKITKSLASISRTIAEISGTLASIPFRVSKISKAGFSTTIPFYKTTPYKAFQKLLEQTNSSLYIKEMSKHIDSEQTGFRPKTKLDKAASAIIAYPEHLLQGLSWIPTFQSRFAEISGKEFDFSEYLSNPNYYKSNIDAIEDAATFADVETKKIIGGGLKAEGRMKVQILPELVGLDKAYLDANTRLGKTASLLGNYMWRENYEMINGLKGVVNGDDYIDKLKGGGKAFGILINMAVYSLTRAVVDSMMMLKVGNDEDKEKAMDVLNQISTGDYYKNMLISQLATSMSSKYGQVGRETVYGILSYYYNQIEDKDEKEAFGKFIEDNFYKKPMKGGYGLSGRITEEAGKVLLPDVHYLIGNMVNTFQGGKNEMGITEFIDKLDNNELSTDDEEKYRLFNMGVAAINLGALVTGQAVPKDILLLSQYVFDKPETVKTGSAIDTKDAFIKERPIREREIKETQIKERPIRELNER